MKLLLPIEIEIDRDARRCPGDCPLLDVDDQECLLFGSLTSTGKEDEDGIDVMVRHPMCIQRAREIVSQETSEWLGEDGTTFPVELLAMRRPM